ncbi:MAG: hypothetical protein ACIAQU_02075, partial [Phycisphaerales bacterium JB064]
KLGARRRAIELAIGANYLSAWAGLLLVVWAWGLAMDWLPGDYLSKLVAAHWLVFAAFTLVGYLIELPVLWLAFDAPRRPKRVLAAIALANAATALGLVCWYGVSSDLSLASRFDSVREPAMIGLEGTREAKTEDGTGGALPWVYYIARDGQTVRRVRLDGSEASRVTELPEAIEGGWLQGGLRVDGDIALLLQWSRFEERAAEQDWSQLAHRDFYKHDYIVLDRIGAAGSIFPEPSPWIIAPLDASNPSTMQTRADPYMGLQLGDDRRPKHYLLSTPFIWGTGTVYASRLPGNVFVFQVGSDIGGRTHGIYVASLDTMRIALLVEDGIGPCVVYDHPPPGWDADALLERLQNPR